MAELLFIFIYFNLDNIYLFYFLRTKIIGGNKIRKNGYQANSKTYNLNSKASVSNVSNTPTGKLNGGGYLLGS